MPITVVTRAGKGSPLTPTEMDTNITSLARDASQSVEGNVRFANSTEAQDFSNTGLALSPATFQNSMSAYGALELFLGSAVKAPSGKYTTESGIIFQWGSYNYTGWGGLATQSISFLTPMPSVYIVLVVGGTRGTFFPNSISTTGFVANYDGLTWTAGTGTLYWLAIGS